LVNVAPTASVALTVNEAVPAALGVPFNVTVPAFKFEESAATVRPVPPALNPEKFKIEYGFVPLLAVVVWLVTLPAVA